MENITEWLENVFWIFLVTAGIGLFLLQIGMLDEIIELAARLIFQDYVLNFT